MVIYDNLSRAGVERNAAWLCETHGDLVRVEVEDIRDAERLACGDGGHVGGVPFRRAGGGDRQPPFAG